MMEFEFRLLSAGKNTLIIGIVEAESLMEAVREVGEYQQADPDAAFFEIGPKDLTDWVAP